MFVYIVRGIAVVTLVSLWGVRGSGRKQAKADRRNAQRQKVLNFTGRKPTADDEVLAQLAEQERQRQRGQ